MNNKISSNYVTLIKEICASTREKQKEQKAQNKIKICIYVPKMGSDNI